MEVFYERKHGIQDSLSFRSHSPLLDPNPDLFYQMLIKWGTYSLCLMPTFSSISGPRDGKLKDYTHLTFGEKLHGDLVN